MAVFETWLKSDLKKPLKVVQLEGNLFSADNGGNLIGVEVMNNGQAASLSGGVSGYVIRADGATLAISGTLAGNRASIVLPASAYVVVGQASIVIKVGMTTVGACVGYVYRTTTDAIVDPGRVIPSMAELLAQIETMRELNQTVTAQESGRVSAESIRVYEENQRAAAETARDSAETARASAETARAAAETARASAETDRATAETGRATAETGRVNAESGRVAAETARDTAETDRGTAEAARSAAETARAAAETARASAETARDTAETARAAAESARDAAETQRATDTAAAIAAAEAATGDAEDAADMVENITVAANGLAPGSQPTATVSIVDGHLHIVFGSVKGDPGKDFEIRKTFSSIAEMQAYDPETDPGTRKVRENDFVMIDTGSVQDVDTGKLYCYEPTTVDVWRYIGDLSGSQGIKGDTGTGIDHVTLNADYTLTVYYDDGTSDTTASIRGATGITPAISIGSVTTLSPNQQAFVELDQTSTPEAPVINFGIPKGDTGAIENLYASAIPMSQQDSTRVDAAINGKASKVSGATDGNFAGLDANGNLTDSGIASGDVATKADVNSTQDGIAIVANGNTHVAISSGQFVYVKNHDTLAEGLYKASAAISANGALSTSNLTSDGSGGLNALQTDLNDKYTALNSKIIYVDSNTISIESASQTTNIGEVTLNIPSGYKAIGYTVITHSLKESWSIEVSYNTAYKRVTFTNHGVSTNTWTGHVTAICLKT